MANTRGSSTAFEKNGEHCKICEGKI